MDWAVMAVLSKNIAGMLWHKTPAMRRRGGGSWRRRTSNIKNVVQQIDKHSRAVAIMVDAFILKEEDMLVESVLGA
jgi:hypothetical protein